MPNESNMRLVNVLLRREIYYDGCAEVAVPANMTDAEVEELMDNLSGAFPYNSFGDDFCGTDIFVTEVDSLGPLEAGYEPEYRLVMDDGAWKLQ